eukprot:343033-Pleurochrysis_carterae.AAC.2
MEADDAPSPCRPRNLSSEWEQERKGPDLLVRSPKSSSPKTSRPSPIEEDSQGVPAVPVSFGTDTADILTESTSHELLLQTSSTVPLDREAPFGGGKEGSGVPLALSSEVGTQGTSRIRAGSLSLSPVQSGLERRKGEG